MTHFTIDRFIQLPRYLISAFTIVCSTTLFAQTTYQYALPNSPDAPNVKENRAANAMAIKT